MLLEISQLLNRALVKVFADPIKRSWFNLFCVMNYDRSGKVTYVELAKFLRKNIHISLEDLPEAKLLSVWMALDADDSGSINGGEFGHFMRLADMERAKGPPPKTWKQKLMEDQQERGRLTRRESDKQVGKDMFASLAEVPPADKDTVRRLSELLNSKLTLFPRVEDRTWYKLFHYIDHNGTGRISWYEFRAFIRTTLELSQDRLPDERIKAVWKALDADGSGYIAVAEFGPFIGLGKHMANRRKHEKSPQEIYQAKFAATQRRRDHENALAAHVSLRRISDRTDYLQREAASLEALLQNAQHAKMRIDETLSTKMHFSASAPSLPSLKADVRPAIP